MFEQFTDRSRQVVVLAQQEARALRHNHIGTEHILLGLLREEDGLAARALGGLGVTLERARADVARVVGTGEEEEQAQIPFTPRAKKVLELSLRVARSMGHNYIGTEHILLGLVREGEGVAVRVLTDLNTDGEQIRNEVFRLLSVPRGPSEYPAVSEYPSWPSLEGPNRFMDQLAGEIRRELRREPDAADLLLVLACAGETLSGRALGELGIDLDALWGTVERLRREQAEEHAELDRQTEEVRQAKERAIEAREFERAAHLRDRERQLSMGLRDWGRPGPQVLQEIRRRLGLPDPPSAAA